MEVTFDPIEGDYIKNFFPTFFHKNSIFFEIMSNYVPIGFYGIKSLSEKVCEISVYIDVKSRIKTTKNIAIKCLSFPLLLGFSKILIRTELQKMYRFLSKMTNYGVNYLSKHGNIYLFEVLL